MKIDKSIAKILPSQINESLDNFKTKPMNMTRTIAQSINNPIISFGLTNILSGETLIINDINPECFHLNDMSVDYFNNLITNK